MGVTLTARAGSPGNTNTSLLLVPLTSGQRLPRSLAALDRALGGALGRAVSRGDFRGGRDEVLHLAGGRRGPRRILLVGLGKPTDRGAALRRAATIAGRQANKLGAGDLAVWCEPGDAGSVEQIGIGLQLGAWEYPDLKTPPPPTERRAKLKSAVVLVDDVRSGRVSLARAAAIGAGYDLSRRLAMMPGNICTPALLADTASDIGKRHGLGITVLGRKEMLKLNMGSFLAVAEGTPQEPKLVALEYRKGKPKAAPIVLVGKGLCFDTGGISIKPAERMEFMKFDMCGAAGVLGAMEAIARLQLPVNVVGVFGATTNMPSGTAVKPGDVVRASSGKTIEIINTDAEGRLVLADVLHWVKRFKPAVVVDAATLTGACVIALGNNVTGAMGNDPVVMTEVIAASNRASEPAWQLPLFDEYKEQIRSTVADIKNTGGRAAGAITAAAFLAEFVDFPWVHLDVAGTAYTEADITTAGVGPTGVPTGTFIEFVRGRVP